MHNQPIHTVNARRTPAGVFINCFFALGVVGLSSCGPGDKDAKVASAAPASAAANTGKAAAPVKAQAEIEAKPINLKKFPVMEGGEVITLSPANMTCKVKGDVRTVFEFQRAQFAALGWKEQTDTSVNEQSASGVFRGAGYNISVSVYPVGDPTSVNLMLHNHGSADLAQLPMPSDAKVVYVGPLSVMKVTDTPVAEATGAIRKLLTDAGWEPHGNEGDSWHFKKGLNRISATIQSAPAQGGKTMISYGSELMSGDLPAPPDAQDVRYVDTDQELTFTTTAQSDAVIGFYKEKLAKTGWKQDEGKPFRIDDYDQVAYRSAAGEVIFLKLMPERQGSRRVSLGYLSAEDIVELNKKTKAEGERIKTRLAAEKAKMEADALSKPKLALPIPAGASGVEQSAGKLKFTVPNGRAKATVDGWRKQLRDAGWKEDSAALEAMAGGMSFSKDGQNVSVNYTDTGFIPAEVGVMVIGVELEKAAAAQ